MGGKRITIMGLALVTIIAAGSAFAGIKGITLGQAEELMRQKPGGFMLIDARAESRFTEGHLPGAVSLPWPQIRERVGELPGDKNLPLVFYCSGVQCDVSERAAEFALAQGHTDVSVFYGGEPAWREAGLPLWVTTPYVQRLLEDRERVALLVDSRPSVRYLEGTIPGAVSIPYHDWNRRQGLLPADKGTEIIFFCGGVTCDLSHKSADRARELGYRNTRIYNEGLPVWKAQAPAIFAGVDPRQWGRAVPMAGRTALQPGEISQEAFIRLLVDRPADLLLVDVRPEAEFSKAHIPGTLNVPEERLAENLDRLRLAAKVVFFCATGNRSMGIWTLAEKKGLAGTEFFAGTIEYPEGGGFAVK